MIGLWDVLRELPVRFVGEIVEVFVFKRAQGEIKR